MIINNSIENSYTSKYSQFKLPISVLVHGIKASYWREDLAERSINGKDREGSQAACTRDESEHYAS